ncbi:MAG: glycoside hydrolase family 32 protein, partial [Flavobacteriaceae bacterium]
MRTSVRVLLLAFFVSALFSCKDRAKEASTTEITPLEGEKFKEAYRPQFHFTPEEKWMNDPNGLVYKD